MKSARGVRRTATRDVAVFHLISDVVGEAPRTTTIVVWIAAVVWSSKDAVVIDEEISRPDAEEPVCDFYRLLPGFCCYWSSKDAVTYGEISRLDAEEPVSDVSQIVVWITAVVVERRQRVRHHVQVMRLPFSVIPHSVYPLH